MPGAWPEHCESILRAPGYHVMNRGHRGGALFLDDTDRRRFLGAVADLPERFEQEVHVGVNPAGEQSDGSGALHSFEPGALCFQTQA
jgi:hypothetical protein